MSNDIRVEFSGVLMLSLRADATAAEVLSVDVSVAMGGSQHFPVLLIEDHDGLSGARPDSVIVPPGGAKPLGLWSLQNAVLELPTSTSRLTVNDSHVLPVVAPAELNSQSAWASIRRIPDLAEIVASEHVALTQESLINARVMLRTGVLEALMPPPSVRNEVYNFEFQGQSVFTAPRSFTTQCVWSVDVQNPKEFAIVRGPSDIRRITVMPGCRATVSNLCICENDEDHFLAFYEVIGSARRPTLAPVVVRTFPENPNCGMSVARLA